MQAVQATAAVTAQREKALNKRIKPINFNSCPNLFFQIMHEKNRVNQQHSWHPRCCFKESLAKKSFCH